MSQNSATMLITHLKSNDEGTYLCKALPPDDSLLQLQAEVVVNIINGNYHYNYSIIQSLLKNDEPRSQNASS